MNLQIDREVARSWVLFGAVLIAAAFLAIRSAPASAACPSIKVIGVRGSGETVHDGGGYGRTVKSVVDWMKILNHSTDSEYVNYRAIDVRRLSAHYYTRDYNDSVGTGIASLQRHISGFLQTCHDSKLFLVGYSQGAQVVADTYQGWLSVAAQRRIERIVLFGDPKFHGRQSGPVNEGTFSRSRSGVVAAGIHGLRTWARSDWAKVRSYCADGDPICNFASVRQAGTCFETDCPHYHYMDLDLRPNRSYTLMGAEFLLQRSIGRPGGGYASSRACQISAGLTDQNQTIRLDGSVAIEMPYQTAAMIAHKLGPGEFGKPTTPNDIPCDVAQNVAQQAMNAGIAGDTQGTVDGEWTGEAGSYDLGQFSCVSIGAYPWQVTCVHPANGSAGKVNVRFLVASNVD